MCSFTKLAAVFQLFFHAIKFRYASNSLKQIFSWFSHFPQMPQHVNVAGDQLKTKTPAFHNCSMNFIDIFSCKKPWLTDSNWRKKSSVACLLWSELRSRQSGFLWYDSQNLIKFLFISYTAQSPPRSPPGSPPNNATN